MKYRYWPILLLILLCSCDNIRAEEVRVFKNSQGKTIEASFVSFSEGQVTIRRSADGQEFTLPVSAFSPEDQAWIQAKVAGDGEESSPGEWGRLVVRLPGDSDSLHVVGINRSASRYRTGAGEYELLLPEGAWIFISVRSAEDPRELVEHLVQYKGAKRWDVSEDDLSLLVSRDGAPARIVGITPPNQNPMQFVRRVDKNLLAEEVCLELPDIEIVDVIDRVGARVVAFTTDRAFNSEDLARISGANPKALKLSLSVPSVSGIAALGELEALSIGSYNTSSSGGGIIRTTGTDQIQLPGLPKVRDLSLFAIPFTKGMGEDLRSHGHLRLFEFVMVSGSASIEKPPVWEGISELAGSLEGIRIDYGLRLKGAELGQLESLKYISMGPGMFPSSDARELTLSEAATIRFLEIRDPAFSGALGRWANEGRLENVEFLSTYRMLDMSKVPKLEVLYMGGRSDSKTRNDLSRLESLSNLRRLSCMGALDEDIETLTNLPSASKLEVLVLRNSKATSLEVLNSLPKLRRLELDSPEMAISSIDLAGLANLECLYAEKLPKLKTLSGALTHPKLASLVVKGSSEFTSFGEPSPNTVLQGLYLEELYALTDLDSFEECTGLTHLSIVECNLIEDVRSIERANDLRYIWLSKNRYLENKSVSDLAD